jgi:hypothetical protein
MSSFGVMTIFTSQFKTVPSESGGISFSSGCLLRIGYRFVSEAHLVIARVENVLICAAAFEKALLVYADAHLEMRQGARTILKSKEEPQR